MTFKLQHDILYNKKIRNERRYAKGCIAAAAYSCTNMSSKLQKLTTEMRNPRTLHIDRCETLKILQLMNQEDQTVPLAVAAQLDSIAQAVDAIVSRFKKGGRLYYVGSGTSGRLGVLDASECAPTFGVDAQQVQGILAGGMDAFQSAQEWLEDDEDAGAKVLDQYQVGSNDVLVGITASGRTPFVLGAVTEAGKRGILTIGISNSENSLLSQEVNIAITVPVGPEVVCGSTRLKAGTAQKLILNMLTTASMIRLGKVYENLMVDLKPTNYKLLERARSIIMEVTGVDRQTAADTLEVAGMNVSVAILMLKLNCGAENARYLLDEHNGVIAQALREATK